MSIHLIAVGENLPTWVNQGVEDYLRRIPTAYSVNLIEICPAKRIEHYNAKKCLETEATTILKAIPAQSFVIALDVLGQSLDTIQLSKKLEEWRMHHRHICFLIGGPDGLSKHCLEKAQVRWSLSALTFPHGLVRVLWAEQMYRAWSIANGHPYHR